MRTGLVGNVSASACAAPNAITHATAEKIRFDLIFAFSVMEALIVTPALRPRIPVWNKASKARVLQSYIWRLAFRLPIHLS